MQNLPEGRGGLFERVGLAVCVFAALLAVWLHIVYLTHAGALWRDEVGAVQLASLPNLGLAYWPSREWIPACFLALVRGWSALGLGGSDGHLRILGLLIGLGLLGAIWLNARLVGYRIPLVSLALLAANATLVRWGDSLRAYGCGAAFILVTLGLVWRLTRKPGVASFLWASAAATLSVQSLYPNSFLVLAACLAGCAVCVRRRRWKTTGLVLGVGLIAGASMLPYVPMLLATRDYIALHRMGFDPEFVWASLSLALGSGLDWPLWVWLGTLALAVGVAWERLLGNARSRADADEDMKLFGVTGLLAGVTLFMSFLRVSGYAPEPWYFLPLMVFACSALDATLAGPLRRSGLWVPVFAAAVICAMFPTTLRSTEYRQTNIDLIAAELQQRAKPGDFIVVSPAYCGITFARYYRAQAAWTTLPPVEDYRCHRTDLLKANLGSQPLLKKVLDQAARTLQSGRALWIVGSLSPAEPGESAPPDLPPDPAPGQSFGYVEGCLRGYIWERQMAHLLDTRAQKVNPIACRPPTGVIPQEDLPLLEARGWRGEQPAFPPPE
jgi:hypothetical protein